MPHRVLTALLVIAAGLRPDAATAAGGDGAGDVAAPPARTRGARSGPLFPATGRLLAASIGIDDRHGYDAATTFAAGSDLEEFRSAILALGVTLVPLDRFLATDLAGLDAVILHTPYTQNTPSTGYSAAEIADLQAFVAGGGGMMACGNSGSGSDVLTPNFNALLAPYGIALDANGSEPSGYTITGLVTHPVTTCVSAFGIDYQQRLTVTAPGLDLTLAGGADDALAVLDGGAACGNVAVLSDSTMWMDTGSGSDRPITFPDNLRLLENIIHFILCEPVPAPCQPLEVRFDRVAALAAGGIEVRWRTLAEERTLGFRVERGASAAGPFHPAGAPVAAAGPGTDYVVLDRAGGAAAWYRVPELTDSPGDGSVSPAVRVDAGTTPGGRARSHR